MEQLNRVNQENNLLKKAYKKKTQQTQPLLPKAKTSTKNTGTEATKVGKNQFGKQNTYSDKTAQAIIGSYLSKSHG